MTNEECHIHFEFGDDDEIALSAMVENVFTEIVRGLIAQIGTKYEIVKRPDGFALCKKSSE